MLIGVLLLISCTANLYFMYKLGNKLIAEEGGDVEDIYPDEYASDEVAEQRVPEVFSTPDLSETEKLRMEFYNKFDKRIEELRNEVMASVHDSTSGIVADESDNVRNLPHNVINLRPVHITHEVAE